MSAKKGKSKKGAMPIMFRFNYMEGKYSMTSSEMGHFFGVSYDRIKRMRCQGKSDQEIADEASELGGHKPKIDILCRSLSKRRLV